MWPVALFMLPDLAQCGEDGETKAVGQLLSLRELGRLLAGLDTGGTSRIDLGPLRAQLHRFATSSNASPAICGAPAALQFLDGQWDESALSTVLCRRFGAGAGPREAVRFLNGVMSAAPELLLRLPALLEGFDALARGWDAEAFLAHLPELRQAFARLKPQERSDLSELVLALHGAELREEEPLLQMHFDTNEEDLRTGMRLERALAACLRRNGLSG